MKYTTILMMMLLMTSALALDVSINDYDPTPAEAGEYVNVWFKVENDASPPLTGVKITVNPKDGLRLSPGEERTKNVGVINGFTFDTIQYRFEVVRDAIEGPNLVEVIVEESGSASAERDLYIEVEENDLEEVELGIGTIVSDPTRVKPKDDNVKLDVTVQNLGDAKAQAVRAQLTDVPEGITFAESYSDLALISAIEGDGQEVATFYIDVDDNVKPGEYEATLEVRYKYKPDPDEDDYVIEEKKLPVRLSVRSIPLYEISKVDFTPETLSAGDKKVKMTLTLTNVGEEEGESVRVRVYAKTEQPFSFDVTSDFVSPKLEPGESGQATLEFDIDDEANLQNYQMDLEVKNIVDDDVITYQEKVSVAVLNAKPDNSGRLSMYAGIVALLAFLYVGFRAWKKWKAPKKVQKVKSGSYKKSYLDKLKK